MAQKEEPVGEDAMVVPGQTLQEKLMSMPVHAVIAELEARGVGDDEYIPLDDPDFLEAVGARSRLGVSPGPAPPNSLLSRLGIGSTPTSSAELRKQLRNIPHQHREHVWNERSVDDIDHMHILRRTQEQWAAEHPQPSLLLKRSRRMSGHTSARMPIIYRAQPFAHACAHV